MMVSKFGISWFPGPIFRWTMSNFGGVNLSIPWKHLHIRNQCAGFQSSPFCLRFCDCLAKGDAQPVDVTFCRQVGNWTWDHHILPMLKLGFFFGGFKYVSKFYPAKNWGKSSSNLTSICFKWSGGDLTTIGPWEGIDPFFKSWHVCLLYHDALQLWQGNSKASVFNFWYPCPKFPCVRFLQK